MRFLTKVRRIERQQEAAATARALASPSRRPVGVLWNEDARKLSAEELAALRPGDVVVTDFTILAPPSQGATRVSSVERVTRDAGDLGLVFNVAGVAIGRVLQDDGRVVSLDYDRGDVDPDPPQVAECDQVEEIILKRADDSARGAS